MSAIKHFSYLMGIACLATETTATQQERIMNPVVLLTGGIGYGDEMYDGILWGAGRSVEVFSLPNSGQTGSCNKDLKDIRDKRIDHTVNYVKGEVILCGGSDNGKTCLSLDENQEFGVYDSNLTAYRSKHTSAVVNDTLLLVGGPFDFLESWNGSQWTQEGSFDGINDLRYGSCMAPISDDTVLMVGGWTRAGWRTKYTNKMLKYREGVWERMEDFPGPARSNHGCAFIQTPEGDALLVAGGRGEGESSLRDEGLPLNSSYLYNIEAKQWEEVGNLGDDRIYGKIVVVEGRVIMMGGTNGTWKRSLDVEEYDVETKTWDTIQQKIKRARDHFDAVVIPGALVGC